MTNRSGPHSDYVIRRFFGDVIPYNDGKDLWPSASRPGKQTATLIQRNGSMAESLVQLSFEDSVARITLRRSEKRNALTRQSVEQLRDAANSVASNETVRLLILAAEGPVFCAGMDLSEMQQRAKDAHAADLWQQDAGLYREVLETLFWLPKPTLALVQGPALAGGVGLVLACDLVLAAEEAFFALPEPKRGITAAMVAPLLIHRLGPSSARYLLLSGRRVSADEARRLGLCHEVVSADRLKQQQEELCRSILTGSPQALVQTKRQILDCSASALPSQLEAGMRISAEARQRDEASEGLAAFLEKRTPRWWPQERPQNGG